MPFKVDADIDTPALYQKQLRAALAASGRKPALLRVFENFTQDNKRIPLVLVGPVDSKLLQRLRAEKVREVGKGTVTETPDLIRYKSTAIKVDLLEKGLKAAKLQKQVVLSDFLPEVEEGEDEDAEVEAAEQEAAAPKTPVAPAPALALDKLLDAAKAKFEKQLQPRYEAVEKRSEANVKARLKAHADDCRQLLASGAAKEASKAVVEFDKLLETAERLSFQRAEPWRRRLAGLVPRVAAIELASHAALKKALTQQLAVVERAIDSGSGLGEDGVGKVCDAVARQVDEIEKAEQSHRAVTATWRAKLAELRSRLAGFKPPLHVVHQKQLEELFAAVETKMAGPAAPVVKDVETAYRTLQERFDALDAVAEKYADGLDAFNTVKGVFEPLRKIAEKRAPTLALEPRRKMKELLAKLDTLKTPAALYEKDPDPYAKLTTAFQQALAWLRENAIPKPDPTTADPVQRRMQTLVHDNPRTWELNPVVYLNGTSASDIGNRSKDLETAALSSRTTAKGSVLKINFEGHEHLDSGGRGFAFVYKLEDDYTVTPTVVDISDKRGGKNGNQYEWRTGGGWSYFPPKADY